MCFVFFVVDFCYGFVCFMLLVSFGGVVLFCSLFFSVVCLLLF